MRVSRIDVGELARPEFRADKTVVFEGRLTRTGVFVYRNPDGSERREYRSPEEVGRADSLKSFRMIPVTNNHPPQMLNASNARNYMCGATGENVKFDGKWITAPIAVYDAALITDIKNGKTQLSNGYDCDLVMDAGVSPEGERYDARQTNIMGNHVAFVDDARAGKEAAIRMDAAVMVDTEQQPRLNRIDGAITMDLAQALAALAAANTKIGEQTQRADAAERDRDDAKKRADKLEAERDDAKTRLEKAERERNDAVAAQSGQVTARVALIGKALAILPRGEKPDTSRIDGADQSLVSMNERQIKLAVIKHVTNADCANGPDGKPRSDDYVNARYDAAIEQASASADTFRAAHNLIEIVRQDGNGNGSFDKARADAKSEYDKMVDNNRNSWKQNGQTNANAAK